MVELNVIWLLVLAELVMVVAGGAVFFAVRARSLARALAAQPAEPVPPPGSGSPDYLTWLREALDNTEVMRSSLAGPDAEADEAQAGGHPAQALLELRKRYLELELNVQEVASDADVFRARLVEGLQTVSDACQPAAETAEEASAPAGGRRYEEELQRLRSVIDNQHDIMRELRAMLEAHTQGQADADQTRAKLDEFARQAAELERCVGALEQENTRLKSAEAGDGPGEASSDSSDGADSNALRSLIGNQQETISNLQSLVQSLVPEAEKAEQLTSIISRIERANQELNGCVVILEDENELLRGRVRELEQPEGSGEGAAPGGDADVADVE